MTDRPRLPQVTLAELWERRSGKGAVYFSGFMGRSKVLLLSAGERAHKGEMVKVWNLVVAEQEPRRDGPAQ